ncbi:hypothetical protein Mterra_03673 [Calidithermus terrae]|uniref:ubiquitinyl hydrolase 1 n=1 Tax=Calidithermus terrae TaxID=1408545 RepID=A0A399E3C1_9DEIN|nr:hypothetical protein Mterra_03673 [Calidithermus terrae]
MGARARWGDDEDYEDGRGGRGGRRLGDEAGGLAQQALEPGDVDLEVGGTALGGGEHELDRAHALGHARGQLAAPGALAVAHEHQQVLELVRELADGGAADGVGRPLDGVQRAEERGHVAFPALPGQVLQRVLGGVEVLEHLGGEELPDVGVLAEELVQLLAQAGAVGGVLRRLALAHLGVGVAGGVHHPGLGVGEGQVAQQGGGPQPAEVEPHVALLPLLGDAVERVADAGRGQPHEAGELVLLLRGEPGRALEEALEQPGEAGELGEVVQPRRAPQAVGHDDQRLKFLAGEVVGNLLQRQHGLPGFGEEALEEFGYRA